MSGIAGILNLDGGILHSSDLQAMRQALGHRGPDGSNIWHSGSVGFAHLALFTTPESHHDPMPRQHQQCVITSDSRLDNRDDLILQLKLPNSPKSLTDTDLILAAYEKWGTACAAKLVGDFAFAIWDVAQNRLFCARDHLGLKPLYFLHIPGRIFAFASEIKGLLALPGYDFDLDEQRIADFLMVNYEDRQRTFYKLIYRLPAAHCLVTSESGVHLERYWALDPERELHFESDDDYAEAFLELFSQVIRSRLCSQLPTGSLLSGGLDSSSIVCMAEKLLERAGRNQRLHTFSAVFPGLPDAERAMADERPFIEIVLASGQFEPHFVPIDQRSPLGHTRDLLGIMDEPYIAPNLFMHWGIYQAAQQAGVRVLLDGFGGDSVISHGTAYLTELSRTHQWQTFAHEIQSLAKVKQTSPWYYLQQFALGYFTEMAQAGQWGAFMRNANVLPQHFPVTRQNLILNYGLKPVIKHALGNNGSRAAATPHASIDLNLLRPEFARRAGYSAASVKPNTPTAFTQRAEQYDELNSAVIPIALEEGNKATAALGMDTTYPYLDRRLMEFCLALPPNQKLRDGWGRAYMRRALKDILPEPIRWRQSKGDLSPNFRRGMLSDDWSLIQDTLAAMPDVIGDYVNVPLVQAAAERYPKARNNADELILWKATTLTLWLQSFQSRTTTGYPNLVIGA
jgi:asparagine synthase (glutamine-hydrolysing)